MRSDAQVYAYGCFAIQHGEGLLRSIEHLRSAAGLIVPDWSVPPLIAPILRGKFDHSKVTQVAMTYDALDRLFIPDKVILHPEMLADMRKHMKREVEVAQSRGVDLIADKAQRFYGRLAELGSHDLPSDRVPLYDMVLKFVSDLDKKLDLRTKDEVADDPTSLILKNFAYGVSLATQGNSRGHTFMTRDDLYVKLMDAFFGIGYSLAEQRDGINPVHKHLNHPRLSVALCDVASNANQPYEIERSTENGVKPPQVLRKWLTLPLGQKAELSDYIRTGLANVSALLSQKKHLVSVSARVVPAQDTSSDMCVSPVVPEAKMMAMPEPTVSTVGRTGSPVSVDPSPVEARNVTMIPHSTSVDLSEHLHRVYLGVRIDAQKLAEIDQAGQLEARVKVYSDLAVIARELGAGKVIDLIGKDVQAIRLYVAGDKTRAWEQEGARIKEELRMLDDVVAVLATRNEAASPLETVAGADTPPPQPMALHDYENIVIQNLSSILAGPPQDGTRYDKLSLKNATGLTRPGQLSGIMKQLIAEGVVNENDYGVGKGDFHYTFSRKLVVALAGKMKSAPPTIPSEKVA